MCFFAALVFFFFGSSISDIVTSRNDESVCRTVALTNNAVNRDIRSGDTLQYTPEAVAALDKGIRAIEIQAKRDNVSDEVFDSLSGVLSAYGDTRAQILTYDNTGQPRTSPARLLRENAEAYKEVTDACDLDD